MVRPVGVMQSSRPTDFLSPQEASPCIPNNKFFSILSVNRITGGVMWIGGKLGGRCGGRTLNRKMNHRGTEEQEPERKIYHEDTKARSSHKETSNCLVARDAR